MRIYKKPEEPTLMRINIKQQGHKTEHIPVIDVSQEFLIDWLKKIIKDWKHLDVFATGKVLTVEVRESIKGENGKTVSFHFKGKTPKEVYDYIVLCINNS